MKNNLLCLLALTVIAGTTIGCNSDDDGPKYENAITLTIASQLTPASSNPDSGIWQDYIVKYPDSDQWTVFPYSIPKLNKQYTPGTEYVVRVAKVIHPESSALVPGNSVVYYELIEIVSRQEKDSEGADNFSRDVVKLPNPSGNGWIPVSLASKKHDSGDYIVKIDGNDKWERFPYEIEGFDFTPRYEYTLHIEKVQVAFPIKNQPIRRYLWMETVKKEEKDTQGIDDL